MFMPYRSRNSRVGIGWVFISLSRATDKKIRMYISLFLRETEFTVNTLFVIISCKDFSNFIYFTVAVTLIVFC